MQESCHPRCTITDPHAAQTHLPRPARHTGEGPPGNCLAATPAPARLGLAPPLPTLTPTGPSPTPNPPPFCQDPGRPGQYSWPFLPALADQARCPRHLTQYFEHNPRALTKSPRFYKCTACPRLPPTPTRASTCFLRPWPPWVSEQPFTLFLHGHHSRYSFTGTHRRARTQSVGRGGT